MYVYSVQIFTMLFISILLLISMHTLYIQKPLASNNLHNENLEIQEINNEPRKTINKMSKKTKINDENLQRENLYMDDESGWDEQIFDGEWIWEDEENYDGEDYEEIIFQDDFDKKYWIDVEKYNSEE